MKPKKRQKLCHNCEGEIDLDVIVCPFCAADLREEKPEQLRSLFNPSVKKLNEEFSLKVPLYPTAQPAVQETARAATVEAEELPADEVEEEAKPHSFFRATIFFTLGVQLFLLGLLMLLFSHKGVLVLRWNSSFWFLYCLSGAPFIYFGYRALAKL
jgi:hypothetical protein